MLRGTLRGPFCETARTLPAEFVFRDMATTMTQMAEAIVTDPCMWSPEMPHLYHVDVEAVQGERVDRRISWHDRPASDWRRGGRWILRPGTG